MSKKLLLADDSITIQKVVGITFAEEDYELIVVDNGDAAFEMALKVNPDLILADVFMPGKNGYELCTAVKKDPAVAAIPVLLLTGTFEPFDENKARAAGADSWIAKPFESQALIDRVEELLCRPAAVAAAPQPAVAPPAPVQAAPAVEPAAEDDFSWGDEPLGGADEAAAVPAVSDWQAVESADDDLWGGVDLEEEAVEAPVAAAPEDPFAMPADDDWGDLTEEVAPVRVQETAPLLERESTAVYAGQRPVAVPSVSATPAGPAWEEIDDEILCLDEGDIIEEEDLLEEPVMDSFAPAVAAAPEMAAEPELFDPFADDEEPVGGAAWDTAAEPTAWNDMAEPSVASVDSAWELTDDEEPAVAPAWTAPAAVPAEEEAASAWEMALDDRQPAAAVAPEPAPVAPPAPAAAAPAPAIAAEAKVAALSDEDIARIVEKIAGALIERLAPAVLEKVVWEVVPDLAEAMIRDEIRTIKENIH